MTADAEPSAPDHSKARDALDRLREALAQPQTDDLQLLLKISNDLENLDDTRLSPEEAAAWRARAETRRERARAGLARQSGFKLGLLVGFLAGFMLSGLFAAMVAMHWLVATQ